MWRLQARERGISLCPDTALLFSLGMTVLVLLAQDKGGESSETINSIFKGAFHPLVMSISQVQMAQRY